MQPQESISEILEAVWTLNEQGHASLSDVRRVAHTEVTDHLVARVLDESLIEIDSAERVTLTARGRTMAASILRRHRLAERLLCDVLGVDVEDTEDAACEFEHVIAEGIATAICTLLGHPRHCPHGRPIPEGVCCSQAREQLNAIVTTGDRLQLGETARIAYLSTRDHPRLLTLTSLGMTPGVEVRLLQKWPSFVFKCEETEIAIEEDVARNIHLWRVSGEDEML